MFVVRCYSNMKCEICVWNRTESRKHLKNRTIYVYIWVFSFGVKLTVLREMRYETWNLVYVNRYFCTCYHWTYLREPTLLHTIPAHMTWPSRSSWYGHPDNVWWNVLFSLVISCFWCHSNITCCEKDANFVPDIDDTNTDIESWYWILMALDWVKCCGLHVQTRHVQL